MKKEMLIEMGIDEEKASRVMELYSESIKNMVSKDELTTANNTITQLKETVKKFDGVDIEKLKTDVTNWETKYNTDILNIKKNNAVDMAIMQAKGKNTKAIKALIDMEKVTLKDDGTLEGLDIEGLKKSDSYLFDVETVKTEGTGFSGGSGFSDNDNINSIVANAMGVK